jgi:hypothetical protein
MKANVIDPDDFCEFVKQHGHAVVSRRLSCDALRFVQNYVFPPSHAELLSVRGTYKKRERREDLSDNLNLESGSSNDADGGSEQETQI